MAFDLIFKPIVIFDVEEALEYYNLKIDGLGHRFYLQYLITLSKIKSAPFYFSYVKKPVRRCKIPNFPYKVLYVINEEKVVIIGVTHEKRSNTFVRKRLRLLK